MRKAANKTVITYNRSIDEKLKKSSYAPVATTTPKIGNKIDLILQGNSYETINFVPLSIGPKQLRFLLFNNPELEECTEFIFYSSGFSVRNRPVRNIHQLQSVFQTNEHNYCRLVAGLSP